MSQHDYADILRSFKHIPTINVSDIANMIAKITNRLVAPGTFTPFDGKIAENTKENVESAKNGDLLVGMPFLKDERPKTKGHPVTGVNDKYMLFDWFHQENCSDDSEMLRRASLVKELAGYLNTQAAEQLHRDKSRDLYWLNELGPVNHMFAFRLVTHLKNEMINREACEWQSRLGRELKINSIGQFIRADLPEKQPVQGVGSVVQGTLVSNRVSNDEIVVEESMCVDENEVQLETGPSIRVDGVRFRKVRITGDGNCLFRAVGHCLNHYTEHDHKILRKMAHDWCLENQSDITLSDSQISEIGKDGVFGSDVSLRALADRLKITIKVVYELSKTLGQDEQTYNPTTGRPKEVVYLYFSIRGSHYDALQREEGQPDAIYSGWLQSSQVIQEVDTALAKDQHKTKTRKRQNETEAENKSPQKKKNSKKVSTSGFSVTT